MGSIQNQFRHSWREAWYGKGSSHIDVHGCDNQYHARWACFSS